MDTNNIKESYNKYISLEKDLKELEKQIFDLESYYLDETLASGFILFFKILRKHIKRLGRLPVKKRNQVVTLILKFQKIKISDE
jgi:hypothetical protein